MAGFVLSLGICAQFVGVGGFVAPLSRWQSLVKSRLGGAATSVEAQRKRQPRNRHMGSTGRIDRSWTGEGSLLTLSGGGQDGGSAARGLKASASSSSTVKSEMVGSTDEQAANGDEFQDTRVPITLISGFLGAGKTSMLQSLLRNREGVRIGMVVNDMAEVNVDAKLVRDDPGSQGTGVDSVELQNGCICCSMSQELFVSVSQLIELANAKGQTYDHIVIESSGISEPKSVRTVFQDAEAYGVALMNEVRLDTMVTVVDAGSFLEAYTSGDRMLQRPDLGIAEDDPAFQQSMIEGGGAQRSVVDLLVEQVECADVLVLNKMDTLAEDKKELLMQILLALNPHARIFGCTYGNVGLEDVLGVMDGEGVADFGTIDDHKEAVLALETSVVPATEAVAPAASSDHAHSHLTHGETDPSCEVCQEEERSSVSGGVAAGVASSGHGHSHAHNDHAHEGLEYDPDCAACNDEEEHGHDHSHNHGHGESFGEGTTTAAKRFGIDNFVYRQRRPFHPERLARVLKHMPSSSNLALAEETVNGSSATGGAEKEATRVGGGEGEEMDAALRAALGKLVRSKGFMWLAFSDKAAMYWSHAGASFEVLCLGRWWDSLEREKWPQGQEAVIAEDFEGAYGDRRQELVFIGLGVNEPVTRSLIYSALDDSLLTDAEMALYEDVRGAVDKLPEVFPSPLRIRFS